MYVLLNGELLLSDSVWISPLSEGFSFGYGLFETIKVSGGQPLFWDQHLERFEKGARSLNLPLSYKKTVIRDFTAQLIEANAIVNGVVKILYAKNKDQYNLLINSRANPYTEEKYNRGFKLCFAEAKKNQYAKLTYIKSNNYLENILAKNQALKSHCDEAIFLNVDNILCEGTATNIFFVKKGKIYSPSIPCGLLPGILREQIIALILNLNLPLDIGTFRKEDLYDADEIFLTNSLMDIMPVAQLEEKKLDLLHNDITRLLQTSFNKRIT